MYESKFLLKFDLFVIIINKYLDTDNPTSSPSRFIYHYETISSLSPGRSPYENNMQSQSTSTSSPSIAKEIIPPFQKKLLIIPVIILGVFEILGGLIVLVLEVLVFDIAVGLWCGLIYGIAGAAAIVLGL